MTFISFYILRFTTDCQCELPKSNFVLHNRGRNSLEKGSTMHSFVEQYHRDGFAVIEDFFTESEVNELRAAGIELTNNLPDKSERKIFNTVTQKHGKEQYFIESSTKISPFFEADALDAEGNLLVEPKYALNKVGHALHLLHPVFKKYSFDNRIKEVCYQLGFKEPVIPQSMYIYKNPGVGSEVTAHQDATFIHTTPIQVLGLWFALDDATLENGCLWAIPQSHKGDVHRRFVRNTDKDSDDLMVFTGSNPHYQDSSFRSLPVKKGSCVLIHGLLVHRSDNNKSKESRHAYTLHIFDNKDCVYSPDNWLQISEGYSFPKLYSTN